MFDLVVAMQSFSCRIQVSRIKSFFTLIDQQGLDLPMWQMNLTILESKVFNLELERPYHFSSGSLHVPKNIGSNKNFGSKENFGSRRNFGSEKNIGSKTIVGL